MQGLEVAEVIKKNQRVNNLIIGEILSLSRHPNADKLKLAKVKTARGEQEIVCGAPNAEAGKDNKRTVGG